MPPIRARTHSLVLALAAPLILTAAASGQALVLAAQGGSMPGSLNLELSTGNYPFEPCFILTGVDAGPTPIAIFDPNDQRSVQIGQAYLGNSFFGVLGLDGRFRVGPTTVPNSPPLVDAAFFFQGITLFGPFTIVDRISNATAVRLAPAGAFRGRNVSSMDERAFGVVLPRADQKWMIVGGGRGGLLSQVAHRTTEIYDDVTDGFTYGPQLNTERSLHAATRLQDGRWLISGGVDYVNDPQAACEIYDPATDTFVPVAPMLTPRMGHTATLLADGRVFVTGGLAAMTVQPTPLQAIRDTTNTTEIYNPATNTWTAGPNLRTPRAAHVAIPRPDGRILLAGGISWDSVIIIGWLPAVRATCDLYDPVANTISAGPSMAGAHSMTDVTPIGNNRWLVAGGISSLTLTNLGTPTASAEIYDAVANTWSSAGSMATPRGNHKVFALGNNRFLHAGGANGDILNPVALGSTEIYNAGTNSWTAGPPLTIPRAGHAAFLTPRGQLQLFGGATTGGGISLTTEWYFF